MSTARSIISDAYLVDGVITEGETMNAAKAQLGLRLLNQVLGQWSLMPLTIPATAREVFPLTADKGGPSDPYTIGPGGDFNTTRPPSLSNIGLLVTSVSEPFEIARTQYTNDAYASIVQKELTSNYFTGLYYNATFTDGLGTINLWPVPADANTSLVLYRPVQLAQFTSLDTDLSFPPGAVPALTYALASWLGTIYTVPWIDKIDRMAAQFLGVYQRGNTVMADLGLDVALTSQTGVYNILSDAMQQGGNR